MALSNILTLAQSGGFAKPSLYRVTPPAGGFVGVDQILIKSASLPAATLGTIELPYRGRKVKIPSNRTYEPWQITVTYAVPTNADSSTDIRANFQKWIDTLQSPKADGILPGGGTPGDDLTAWGEVWEVALLDPTDNTKDIADSKFTLYGCYPSELGTVSLDTETTDSLAEFSVTIYYSYHTVGTG
jgi:hypothetical protein